MRRTTRTTELSHRMRKSAWVVLAIPTLAAVATFQNCSKVEFETATPSKASTPIEKQSQFAELTAGDAKAFPPLKLVFVVDNSGTMQVNQISLAKAFGKMFEGDNASNLAPFDSTALVINTAQRSIASGDGLFPKIPSLAAADLAKLQIGDVRALRGGAISDGKLAGDLSGYAAVLSEKDGLKTYSYLPSPVLGLDGNSIELGVHKVSGGSVEQFSKAFSDRVSVLDPARSAIDPSTRRGILDPIVDKESGLCAVARVLKNNDGLINKGDLTAFVIVSDEDDADPSGESCIDQVADTRGDEDLIDAQCLTPQTKLSFKREIANPAGPKCNVAFNTGFSYEADVPRTKVSYFKRAYSVMQRQTLIKYKTSTHKYDLLKTNVDYYTKKPTYSIAQTKVTYQTRNTVCDQRDGININCKDSFPVASKVVDGTFSSANCAQTLNKLPNGALNDKDHALICEQATNKLVEGACAPTDSGKINCQQNYSAKQTLAVDGNPASGVACGAFASGRLPADAILDDTNNDYDPVCKPANTRTQDLVGRCDSSKAGCDETLTPAEKLVNGMVSSSKSCLQLLKDNKVAQTDKIFPIFDDSKPANVPTCVDSPAVSRTIVGSIPSTLPADQSSPTPVRVTDKNSKSYDELLNGRTCDAFIRAQAPGDLTTFNDQAAECSVVSEKIKVDETFTPTKLVNYAPVLNADCLSALASHIRSTRNVLQPTTCKITAIKSDSKLIADKTCQQAQPASVCADNTNRSCVGSDIAAGEKYESNLTTMAYDGNFTCDSKCSDTTFCAAKSGSVKDNYYACSVSNSNPRVVKSFQAEPLKNMAKLCLPELELKITRDAYRTSGSITRHVAGADSAANKSNALASFIKKRSEDLFGSILPSVSVFVRQSSDTETGVNGSVGKAYNALADMMDGQKHSVLSSPDAYARSLQSLGSVIREKLDRSFNIKDFQNDQKVLRAWHRTGSGPWVEALEGKDWTASGGTVSLSPNFEFEFGDQFRFEYK